MKWVASVFCCLLHLHMLEVGDSQSWQVEAVDMNQFSARDIILSETRLRNETWGHHCIKHWVWCGHAAQRGFPWESIPYFSMLADGVMMFLMIWDCHFTQTVLFSVAAGMKAKDIADEGTQAFSLHDASKAQRKNDDGALCWVNAVQESVSTDGSRPKYGSQVCSDGTYSA